MARRSAASPSPRLGIPELFAPGPYEQALILTFGADLEFYERVLRRHFGSFRNQIVLADGTQLDHHLSGLATAGALRHLNRSWVAGPIRLRHAAHAKAILLAGPEAGLLLVGSGNLSLQGYAGAGECFVPYRWTPDQPDDLDAFTAVRSLTDALVERALVDRVIADRVGVYWSAYDWWHAPPNPAGPVRHNLDVPIGTQFVEAIAGEPVEELTVVAPFHDERCSALERLVSELHPSRLRVLVQPGRCSVDPTQLRRVMDRRSGSVHSITAEGDHELTYLHAKIFLAKTATRSICLVGSANCSQVALWIDQPGANTEIASLLTGPPSAFDHLLAADVVTVSGPLDPGDLDLEIRDDTEDNSQEEGATPTVHNLIFDRDTLTWTMATPCVAAEDVVVEINGRSASVDLSVSPTGGDRWAFTARLFEEEDIAAINSVAVVTVRIGDGAPTHAVPYQVDRLREQDHRRVDTDRLRHAALLELDDPDLDRALAALEEILVGDNVARWGKDRRPSSDADQAEPIAWENIDWSAVKRHPRYQAYGGLAGFGIPGTALADYLAALSQLVRKLLDEEDAEVGDSDDREPTDADDEEGAHDVASGVEGADPDEEDDGDEDQVEVRRQSPAARNRRLVRNFVRRNLTVLEQPGFRDGAGPGIVVPNLIILNWVCWWIATKDEDHGPDLIEERLRLWELLWGHNEIDGYLDRLDDEHQALVVERFDAQQFEPVVAASITDVWTSIPTVTSPLYQRLRDVVRSAVCSPCWQMTAPHLESAAVLTNKRPSTIEPINAVEIGARLWEAACAPHFEIEARRAVAHATGCLAGDVAASNVEVIVDGRSDRRLVDQMEIQAPVLADGIDGAFVSWMGAVDLSFYRLKWPGGVAFYNALAESGWVVAHDENERTLESLEPAYPAWRLALDRLVDSVEVGTEAAA
ncbi:phospholipase D family protein [Rhabdothermincola salaria]|uniref:phospholipase D family protein n=1 Tax=Rhabdothermincola salaria TaxID=2903142 RepID=UPI001E316D7B|nr:phospholipase D family protein [Rhabdothermincola salaria]MCD9624219.1 phospholipase D family protein [Rhabdothermincola salaria]